MKHYDIAVIGSGGAKPEIPEDVITKVIAAAVNRYGDTTPFEHIQQACFSRGAEFGYHLRDKEIERLNLLIENRDQTILHHRKEIDRLKDLLREVCVRANIIFPEREGEIEMFDEQFAQQKDLYINIGATLGLGEIEDSDRVENENTLKIIQQKFKQ